MSYNIAYVIPHADQKRGGAEAYLMGLVRYALTKGHRVTILCTSAAGVPDGASVKIFPVSGGAARRIQLFWNLLDVFLKNNHFDIVHALDLCPRMNVYNPHGGDEATWLTQYLKSKSGLDKWISTFKRKWGARQKVVFDLEKKQLADKNLKKIIAISPFVLNSIKNSHGLPSSLFELIPNGIDTSQFSSLPSNKRKELRKKYGVSESKKLIVFVAHNFALKGLARFIEAVAELNKMASSHDVEAWVVGTGRKKNFVPLLKSLGMEGIISFKGRMAYMPEVYNVADLTMAPSYYDACSLSTLESLLCGTAVVTTSCNGASFYIEEGVTGAVVEGPDNVLALAKACDDLLKDEKIKQNHKKAALSVEKYTQNWNSERVLSVYEGIVNSK